MVRVVKLYSKDFYIHGIYLILLKVANILIYPYNCWMAAKTLHEMEMLYLQAKYCNAFLEYKDQAIITR